MPTVIATPTTTPGGAVIAGGQSIHFGNPIAWLIAVICFLAGVVGVAFTNNPVFLIAGVIVALIALTAIQIAKAWEKAVVLRLGRFQRLVGPGIFLIIPAVDNVAAWIDQRVQTSTFMAEQTLTKDTVPVDVDAVLFWVVWDAKKAALEVASYRDAIGWAAQTALRDIIGTTNLADLLSNRQAIDANLQQAIDGRTTPWGITVQSVEIRDIKIPENLQDAMSRQAQAERERQARVILGDAERQIAESFLEAAKSYAGNPIALHLRAMNMLYESLKEKGAMIVVPSTAVETMGLGAISGLAALGGASPLMTPSNQGAPSGSTGGPSGATGASAEQPTGSSADAASIVSGVIGGA
ncbi:MAG TPA: slipin family protein [Candidatus Eremiobacteraceae bacterium]|nr:slipin family protein [Candidatus Eremiobacteraceae bacterium]